MYGGTKEIFEQPPPPIPVKQRDEEVTEVGAESISEEIPPIPETGLPDGWTMEQWAHYGKRWLDQQND